MTKVRVGPESGWTGQIVGDDIVWSVREDAAAREVEGQMSLLGDAAGPVRPTDPETSKEAAARPGRGSQRWRVLQSLFYEGPTHDEALAGRLGLHPGSAAKRRQELVQAGLARWTGKFARTTHDSPTRVWMLTDAGITEARRH